ncbi:MAG: hypothetical protein NZM40_03835 [Sphingomonadaceae bacterium]|uniref:VOC family protein n=1 Tax=Thermaurantiacus sp. TaxID=2820283 RepID=UPI00298F16DF|nr:hypothetical protein [Thermaurantiacus sp.]MCS6986555.1 hypothetical protein [Sphingomonadaceae bacterium]MDW8414184.1 hypothetical protein [Thermaurantiacus sp.]
MEPSDTPGTWLCGTVLAPDFAAALADYREHFALRVVEGGLVPPDLARSWGAPAQVGCRYALLAPAEGGSGGFLRLVGGSPVPDYRPLRSYGWAAFELTVRDGPSLHRRLEGTAFRILGPPKPVPGFDAFIPFQVAGRSGEVLYLNTVLADTPSYDLPRAQAEVDRMFIAVLAAEDLERALEFHGPLLGFEKGQRYRFAYSMINQSFGLPEDHETDVAMTSLGRRPLVEVDRYPEAAEYRPRNPGELPPGNALVTLTVATLDRVRAPFIEPPVARDGPLYRGRRVACVRGPDDERVELVECA